MSSRAAVAVYDPALARQATQAELRSKAAPQKLEVLPATAACFTRHTPLHHTAACTTRRCTLAHR